MRRAFLALARVAELFLAGEEQRADVCPMPRGKKGGEGSVGSLGSSLDLHSSPWERRLQDCDVDSGEQLCGEH